MAARYGAKLIALMMGPEGVPVTAEERVATLTDRERDVVVAVAEGLGNAEVGQRLYISEATVKTHLAAAQDKLGARNRVGVAVIAERAGLLRGR